MIFRNSRAHRPVRSGFPPRWMPGSRSCSSKSISPQNRQAESQCPSATDGCPIAAHDGRSSAGVAGEVEHQSPKWPKSQERQRECGRAGVAEIGCPQSKQVEGSDIHELGASGIKRAATSGFRAFRKRYRKAKRVAMGQVQERRSSLSRRGSDGAPRRMAALRWNCSSLTGEMETVRRDAAKDARSDH